MCRHVGAGRDEMAGVPLDAELGSFQNRDSCTVSACQSRTTGRQEIRNEIFMEQVISFLITVRSFRRRLLSRVPADSIDTFVNEVQLFGYVAVYF